MSKSVESNILNAAKLYQEIGKAGLNYGCVETCITALGGDMGIYDVIYRDEISIPDLDNLLGVNGMMIWWMVGLNESTTGDEIYHLLEGNIAELEEASENYETRGSLAGFVLIKTSQSEDSEEDHMMAIIPTAMLGRNLRKSLQANENYLMIDTRYSGGVRIVSPDDLAGEAHESVDNNYEFYMIQVRYL